MFFEVFKKSDFKVFGNANGRVWNADFVFLVLDCELTIFYGRKALRPMLLRGLETKTLNLKDQNPSIANLLPFLKYLLPIAR